MHIFLCVYVGVHFHSSLGSHHLRSEKLIIILWFFCPINICRPSSYLLEHLWNHHFAHVNPVLGNSLVVLREGQLVENPGKFLWIPFSFSCFSIFSLIMGRISGWLTFFNLHRVLESELRTSWMWLRATKEYFWRKNWKKDYVAKITGELDWQIISN